MQVTFFGPFRLSLGYCERKLTGQSTAHIYHTLDAEKQTNLMSLIIKFYLTSFMLNMFRALIHPSSGSCHTETPIHIETRTHNQ